MLVLAWMGLVIAANSYGVLGWWLAQYGLPVDDSGASADSDNDGQLNWQEYFADTDPTHALSFFHIETATNCAGTNAVCFWASSNRQYTLEYST